MSASKRYRKLTPEIWQIEGLNPSLMTGTGTNTYLIGTGKNRLLIDTGEGVPQYKENLKACMLEAGVEKISCILVTHGHNDHTGGILQVKELSFPSDVEVYQANSIYQPIEDGQLFEIDGIILQAMSTPGHSNDSISFLLKDSGLFRIFTGDCILGDGVVGICDDVLAMHNSLYLISSYQPNIIYPGHGDVVEDAFDIIEKTFDNHNRKEAKILCLFQIKDNLSFEELIHLISPSAKCNKKAYDLTCLVYKPHLCYLVHQNALAYCPSKKIYSLKAKN